MRKLWSLVDAWVGLRDEVGLGIPGMCVPAALLGVEVLRRLGVRARPVPVSYVACNPTLSDALECGLSLEEALRVPGADASGVPGGGGRDVWQGHLVIGAGRWFVDLTVDQVNDASTELLLEPFVFEGPLPTVARVGECAVVYEHRPGDVAWRDRWRRGAEERRVWEPLVVRAWVAETRRRLGSNLGVA